MAHEIDFSNSTAGSVLTFDKQAWHNLGVNLPADHTARYDLDECRRISGVDWDVEEAPVEVLGAVAPGYKANVRSDTKGLLGIVSNRYHALQNRDAFNWFKPFIDSKECQIETCGALKGGKIVWVLAKINRDDAVVSQGDTIRKYLLLTTSHDGTKATKVGFCPTRVVCWNTLSAGLSNHASSLLRVHHIARPETQADTLNAIRETVNLANEAFEATAGQYRKLLGCEVARSDLRRYVKLVLELPEDEKDLSTLSKNKVEKIVNLCLSGAGNDGRTAWSAYNGVTDYLTHSFGRSAGSRLNSAWYGESKRLNDRAFELALQLAG